MRIRRLECSNADRGEVLSENPQQHGKQERSTDIDGSLTESRSRRKRGPVIRRRDSTALGSLPTVDGASGVAGTEVEVKDPPTGRVLSRGAGGVDVAFCQGLRMIPWRDHTTPASIAPPANKPADAAHAGP